MAARHERLTEDVCRQLIDRCRQAQQLIALDLASSDDVAYLGVPTVSVPVLSNRTVRASPSVSIAPASLDDHAVARGS